MNKLDRVAIATAQNCDMFYGGIVGSPKFPNVPVLELLWRAYLRTGLQQFLSLTLCALDNMGRGGIYDHIGGGFAPHPGDDQWLVPPFQKNALRQAQVIRLMT